MTDNFRVKSTHVHTIMPPKHKFSSISPCAQPFQANGRIQRNVDRMTLKWPWHVQRQNTVYICLPRTPPKPRFHLFHSAMCHFLVSASFEKMHRMPPKLPWHIRGKNTHVHISLCHQSTKAPYAYDIHPEAHIFVRFALWWAVFKLAEY